MSFLKELFGARAPSTPAPLDPFLLQIARVYPSGPTRAGSLPGVQRGHDLADKAPVIDRIMVFDANDHWFCLLLGCGALDLSFELSIRIGKTPEQAPPNWFVEPATRVANAIGDGAACAPGATWKLGTPLGGATSPFTGFLTLPDLEFGLLQPHRILQLVPVSAAELEAAQKESEQLCGSLQRDRARMIGTAREIGG